MAWLLCLMLLAFLLCSIGLAHAEPDTTSSGNTAPAPHENAAGSDSTDSAGSTTRADSTDSENGADSTDSGDNADSAAAVRADSADSAERTRRTNSEHSAGSEDDGDADADADDSDVADADDSDDGRLRLDRIDGVATDGLDDAQVDAPAPASIEANEANAPTWAHGLDAREAALRRHTSWLGRIDVSITWRRALNESTAVQRDEVWLVGTWRL